MLVVSPEVVEGVGNGPDAGDPDIVEKIYIRLERHNKRRRHQAQRPF